MRNSNSTFIETLIEHELHDIRSRSIHYIIILGKCAHACNDTPCRRELQDAFRRLDKKKKRKRKKYNSSKYRMIIICGKKSVCPAPQTLVCSPYVIGRKILSITVVAYRCPTGRCGVLYQFIYSFRWPCAIA